MAGLAAAYELTRAGHDVTVLEARTRPGGRVHTLRDPFAEGLYAEAGATRVPNHHHFTLKYAELFGLTLDPFEPPDLRRSPKNIGWQRGMFDGIGSFAGIESSFESFLSREVEGPAAAALRKWLRLPQGARNAIPPEVFRYLSWAAARSLPMRQLFEYWINTLPPDAKCTYPPPPGFEKIMWGGGVHRIEHPTLGIREGVPSEQVHALRAEGWQIRLGTEDFLQVLHFQAWYFQVQMFPPLQWSILDAPPGDYFIIADRPVVWGIQKWTEKRWSMATNVPPYYLRDPRVQLIAPLTRSIALFAFHASSRTPDRIMPDDINSGV